MSPPSPLKGDLRGRPWGLCPCPVGFHRLLSLLPIAHQSPVSSRQLIRHDLQPELADSTRSCTYCPDYTVRALSDLQLIKVTVWAACWCSFDCLCVPKGLVQLFSVRMESELSWRRHAHTLSGGASCSPGLLGSGPVWKLYI